MALVVSGNVVSLDRYSAPGEPIQGRVWIDDDGIIVAVTSEGCCGPTGFEKAPIVHAPDDAYVMPGLIDLHNHIAYNSLPLWDANRAQPFSDHEDWKKAATYKSNVIAPAQLWADAEPEALLAYVQARAVVGGTTAIQGWPRSNRSHLRLLRKIDDEGDAPARINQSTLPRTVPDLIDFGRAERNGIGFIYHCAEGQLGSAVATEFRDVWQTGCLTERFMGIHCVAVSEDDWKVWPEGAAVVWSPFSNFWLYNTTMLVTHARASGASFCLGSDWAPSGTKNVLGELKVAKLLGDGVFSCRDLVEMVTTNPGDMLGRCWGRPVGRLTPGAYADVLVLRRKGKKDFWSDVVYATEADVALVISNGAATYGETDLIEQASAPCTMPIDVDGINREIAIPDPADPKGATPWSWHEITRRLMAVANKPDEARQHAAARVTGLAGFTDKDTPPLILTLEMPDGDSGSLGGLAAANGGSGGAVVSNAAATAPNFPTQLPSLIHDSAFFDAVCKQQIHKGILDGLQAFYPAGKPCR